MLLECVCVLCFTWECILQDFSCHHPIISIFYFYFFFPFLPIQLGSILLWAWLYLWRLRGATVARLTPDQKVACSNHVGVNKFWVWHPNWFNMYIRAKSSGFSTSKCFYTGTHTWAKLNDIQLTNGIFRAHTVKFWTWYLLFQISTQSRICLWYSNFRTCIWNFHIPV